MTSPKAPLVIGAPALAGIRAHAAATYPYECCGALIGLGASCEVVEAMPLPNSTEEGPRRRFLVRPQDYLSAERHATGAGRELMGFYHSHPDHPAQPSQHDLDHAWPNLHYIIVSVREGRPAELTAWRLAADRSAFEETPVSEQARGPVQG